MSCATSPSRTGKAARGIPTARGGAWTPVQVSAILHLSACCNLKKRRAIHCYRRHEEIPVQKQVPHLAARLRDQQITMAGGAVGGTVAAAPAE